MDYDALTASQRRKYHAAVSRTHHRRVELVITDLDDHVVRSLTSPKILGGSISGDADRTPAEVLEMQVFDDDNVLDWHHGQHRRYKARVIDSRYIDSLDEWVEATVFTGPLWDFDRAGPAVSLVAQGSERLAMGSVRRVFHRPRKTKATTVVRDLLKSAGAPDRGLRIPRLKAKLPEAVTVGVKRGERRDTNGKKKGLGKDTRPTVQILKVSREDTYWGKAAPIAAALDRDLFADNHGRFVMAPLPGRPTHLGGRHLLAVPSEQRGDDAESTNTWLMLGANPKGPKGQVRVEVGLPKKHPLSAQSLAWHGSLYEVTATVENKHWVRRAQAVKAGLRLRDRNVSELVKYEVQLLPILPYVRPGALFTVPVPSGSARVRARQWTIPLGPDASPLTLGANRRSGWR